MLPEKPDVQVIATKLQAPHLPPGAIPRPRLVGLLNSSLEQRITLVSAPAGYGKTTLLRQFAGARRDVIWYSLDRRDREISCFILHLMAGFALQLDGFCDRMRGRLAAGEDVPTEMLLAAMVNELAERKAPPLVLILDGYDEVESSRWINHALDYLLCYLPFTTRVVISCRGTPRIDALAKLRASRQASIIGQEELRFNRAETVELAERAGCSAKPEVVDAILAKTRGWAVGITMATSVEGGWPPAPNPTSPQYAALAAYCDHEVMARISPALRTFLTRASVLTRLNGSTCDFVLEATNSSALLKRAYAAGLFLCQEGADSYELHPVFRTFLLRRLSRDPNKLRALHRRAAAHFESNHNHLEAANHHLEAQDYECAARLIAHCAFDWLKAEGPDKVIELVARLPSDVRDGHPDLVMAVAEASRILGKLVEAVALYEKAYDLYSRIDDWVRASEALSAKFELTIVGQSILPRADALSGRPPTDSQHLSAAHDPDGMRSLAVYHLSGGDSDTALELYRAAMQIYEAKGNRMKQLDALICPGVYTFWVRGDFREVLDLLQAAEDLARDLQDHYRLAECYCLRAIYLQHMGRYDECLRNAEVGIAMARQIGSIFQEARAMSAKAGAIFQLGGDPAEPLQHYHKALSLAKSGGVVRVMVVSLLGIGDVHRRQGDTALAVHFVRQAQDLVVGSKDRWLRAFALRSLGGAQAYAEPEEALRALSEALSFFLRAKDKYNLAWTHYWLAVVQRNLGNLDSLRQHLRAALYLAAENDYARVFGDEPRLSSQLLVDALGWNINVAFAEKTLAGMGEAATEAIVARLPNLDGVARALCARILGAIGDFKAVYWLPALSKDPDERVRLEAQKAITALRRRPLPPLKILLLGPVVVQRGTDTVDTGTWKRRKAVSLLACLALNRRHGVHRDVLIEKLFPEMDCEAARNNLHVTIHQLREYLDPLSQQSGSFQYITYSNDCYFFDTGAGGMVDVEVFRETIEAARRCSDVRDGISRYEQALRIYAGELLSGLPYEEWCVPEREELNEVYLGALARLAQSYLQLGDHHSAEMRLRKILSIDNTREDIHRELILLYGKIGNRPAAARQYCDCERILKEELGISPSPTTTDAFRHVVAAR